MGLTGAKRPWPRFWRITKSRGICFLPFPPNAVSYFLKLSFRGAPPEPLRQSTQTAPRRATRNLLLGTTMILLIDSNNPLAYTLAPFLTHPPETLSPRTNDHTTL